MTTDQQDTPESGPSQSGKDTPEPGDTSDLSDSEEAGEGPNYSLEVSEDTRLPPGVSTAFDPNPYDEELVEEDPEAIVDLSASSRAAQKQLALQALGKAIDETLDDADKRELRKAAANAMAEAATKPEGWLDAMEQRPSKFSGEKCLDAESKKRKHEHHNRRDRDRGNEALGSPEGEEAVGHHSAALDLIYEYTGEGKKRKYDPVAEEYSETFPVRFVPGRYGVVPSWLINTNAVTNSERAILSFLYEKHDEGYRHHHEGLRVSGFTQQTIGHHVGLSRWHVNELLQGLQALGLIDIQDEGDFEDPVTYYLPVHEPTWLTFPLGSTYSGRSRVQAAASLDVGDIDWQSFRANETVRIRAQADREAAKNLQQSKDGKTIVDEKHRQVRVSEGAAEDVRDGEAASFGAAIKDYLLRAMPASAREALDDASEEATSSNIEPATTATTREEGDLDTEIEYQDPDELQSFEERVEERLQRLIAAEDGDVGPEQERRMRDALRRSMSSGDGAPSAGGKGGAPPGCG